MGWSTGSGLMYEVIRAVSDHVTDCTTRQGIYESLIPAWEAEDCDTLDELLGEDLAFDCAMEMHKERRAKYLEEYHASVDKDLENYLK